ncbi:toxin ParE1/3/4 [Rhizobium pisi]
MPYRVLFAEDAERDVEDLYRFIAHRDGAETAERILTEIERACTDLEEFPARENIPKELASIGISEYRELHHKPWRMIYRTMGTDVVVYCVVDGRRDVQAFLERRLIAEVRHIVLHQVRHVACPIPCPRKSADLPGSLAINAHIET